jgi:predicted nuclease with TOPRIM domain
LSSLRLGTPQTQDLAEAREMAASLHVENGRLQQTLASAAQEVSALRAEREELLHTNVEVERANAYHMRRAMLLEMHLRQALADQPKDTLTPMR